MLPRAYWKGSLKLSLVTCPVALYPASTSVEKTRFHMINRETGNRLKQQMVDSETGDVVEADQKGRGYEISKGEYVPVEKDELEASRSKANHTIDIDSFVPRDEIDRRYLDHPYYLVPDGKAGVDAFAVIRDAMKDQDRVALARIVLTNREHIIAIEPLGKGLLATTLRYDYEVRDEDDFFSDIKSPKISKDMVDLAAHILDTKAAHFDPKNFKDEYETALKSLIKNKAAGKPIKMPERVEKSDNVISLMDALQRSLKAGGGSRLSQSAAKRTAKKASRSARPASQGGLTLLNVLTAVDVNLRAVHIGGRFGAQHVDDFRHFVRLAETLQRNLFLDDLVGAGRQDRGVDLAGRDCIDAHSDAAEIMRHLAGQRGERGFRCGIGRAPRTDARAIRR